VGGVQYIPVKLQGSLLAAEVGQLEDGCWALPDVKDTPADFLELPKEGDRVWYPVP
jgi:hypothetical protein